MIIDKTLAVIGICIWWAFTAFSGGFMGYCLGYKRGRGIQSLFSARFEAISEKYQKKREDNETVRLARQIIKRDRERKADLNTPIADAQQAY